MTYKQHGTKLGENILEIWKNLCLLHLQQVQTIYWKIGFTKIWHVQRGGGGGLFWGVIQGVRGRIVWYTVNKLRRGEAIFGS
jgi:hypothetical protein